MQFWMRSECESMNDPLDNLLAKWARLGAGFNIAPAAETPDLERLLLATARHGPQMSRLFIMAATWLNQYGDLVAKSRLKRLILAELAPEHRPVLALLLDVAHQGTHPPQFQSIIKSIPPATSAGPLFEIERSNERLCERARRHASPISQKWGLWCAPIEFKPDALRAPRWVMSHNPGFITRADFRGDLRSSILAALKHDDNAGDGESQLARSSGGSRAQVRNALDNLQLTGKVSRAFVPAARRTRIALQDA